MNDSERTERITDLDKLNLKFWFGKANDTVALNVAHFKLLKMDKSDPKIIISLIFPWLSTAGSSKKM